jgi:hypothetical protein
MRLGRFNFGVLFCHTFSVLLLILGKLPDLFGVGVRDVPMADVSKYARPLLGNQSLLRARALAAVAKAKAHPLCSGRVVVIGYVSCHACVLQVANERLTVACL